MCIRVFQFAAFAFALVLFNACVSSPRSGRGYESVRIAPLIQNQNETQSVYLHTTIRDLEGFGLIPSHGLIVNSTAGLLLIDSAWGDAATNELLDRIQQRFGRLPNAAVFTHFHADLTSQQLVLATFTAPYNPVACSLEFSTGGFF